MVKVTATTALNMYVPIPVKETAVRLRRATGESFPATGGKGVETAGGRGHREDDAGRARTLLRGVTHKR
jgi:hypothetical protein